jgi:hypothetical protein
MSNPRNRYWFPAKRYGRGWGQRNRWIAGFWLAVAASTTAATDVPDYTPSQWAKIDMLRKSADEHANAVAGKACRWQPTEPATSVDVMLPGTAPVSQPALRDKLMAMLKEDQASRDVALAVKTATSEARIAFGDERHRKALIAMLDKYGLPTTAMVGESGVWAMFYLSVHADEDIVLQQRVLGLMKQAAKANTVPVYLPDMFLTVRRNVPMGKPYAEVYNIDQTKQEKMDSTTSASADPKLCFSSKKRTYAEQWLRDHLPSDIAGTGNN